MSAAPTKVLIRERRPEDLDALGDILREVYERDGYPVEGVADPQAWLTGAGILGAWVAILDNQLVGHVQISEPNASDAAANLWADKAGVPLDRLAVGGRLFVSQRGRGHRIGQELTATATHTAQSLGRRAVLDVMAKDEAAIATYERLGWQRFGTITHTFNDGDSVPAYAYVSPEPV